MDKSMEKRAEGRLDRYGMQEKEQWGIWEEPPTTKFMCAAQSLLLQRELKEPFAGKLMPWCLNNVVTKCRYLSLQSAEDLRGGITFPGSDAGQFQSNGVELRSRTAPQSVHHSE